jgi:arylsulfatase A-like enzyme
MRRTWFGAVSVLAVAAALAGFAGFVQAASADRPNIVLILTDDQGYGDLGCFGSTTIETPQIDRLAREGARLTSFYAAAPICTPTRAALMTGCYAARVGLSTPLHVYDDVGLNPEQTTLAEALRDQGYRTGCFGKWHLGHTPEHYPTRHGFDVYWGTPLGHMFDRPALGRAVGDTSDLFLAGEREIAFPDHAGLTGQLTEQAIRFIHDSEAEPFFLFVSHPMPHEPLAVSDRFHGRSEGGLYGDVIECIDWSTGRIVEAIRAAGSDRDTLLVFTSDNGPKRGHGSAGPFRGYKHQPYEGGVRVPCVAWSPGRIEAGRRIDAITTVMDLYPTLVKIAGGNVSPRQVVDGRDLSPLLFGTEPDASVREQFFYFVRHGVLAGVRSGRWKLLRQRDEPAELYDLRTDPAESENMAGAHPEIIRRLTRRMRETRAEVESTARQPAGHYRQ